MALRNRCRVLLLSVQTSTLFRRGAAVETSIELKATISFFQLRPHINAIQL